MSEVPSDSLEERYATLLTPILDALDALGDVAQSKGERPRAAIDFVTFKAYATVTASDFLREQLRDTPYVEVEDAEGAPTFFLDRQAKFALFVLVDSFLFQSASVQDSLLQLVNAAFSLQLPIDKRLEGKVMRDLAVTETSETGLEPWLVMARQPAWLDRLLDLRNTTTHRRVLRLPGQFRWTDDGLRPASWQAHVGIESPTGGYQPLIQFIDETERELLDLLRVSLRRLCILLTRHDGKNVGSG